VSTRQLISSPDGESLDEMAVIALALGASAILAVLTVIGTTVYVVAVRGDAWHPGEFAGAIAEIIGAAGTSIGALAGFMGLKAHQEKST